MPISTSNKSGDVEIKLTAYSNCDDVQLFWCTTVADRPYASIPSCIGFQLERQRKTRGGAWGSTEVLRNRVGFSSEAKDYEDDQAGTLTKPSSIWPFQRYDWTDHGANNGETVRYRVIAVRLPDGGKPGETTLEPIADSGWTGEIIVDAKCGEGVSAYFNRGFVMSQYVARLARQNNWTPRDIKEHIKEIEAPLRRFLSGELRVALLQMLDEVIEDPNLSLYAALYELSDGELVDRLKLLRGRAHIVLANGSKKDGDGNEKGRRALNSAGVDVHDRLLGSKGLGHNKFAVVVRTRDHKPLKAWTGSTNWAPTGLCTQVNNGILFENGELAQIFFEQWGRLDKALGGFPKTLVEANARSPRSVQGVDVWFTRVRNPSTKYTEAGADIQALVDLVHSANEAILYVMFQPGEEPLTSIMQRAPEIYVRGVVSTVIESIEENFTLIGVDRKSKEYKTALVEPEGIGKGFSSWIKEVTRKEFLYPFQNPGIGHAVTHSKMIVIDPFSDACKVITGSHNFSKSASEKNDDNFVVVYGNRELAEAYAVACLSTYSHYRWRAYVKERIDSGRKVWDRLAENPGWQDGYLTDDRKNHLSVWC